MPLAKELRLDEYSGYILSFNGGRIINCKTGETVFARSLPVSANKKIIGLAEEHQVDIATYEAADYLLKSGISLRKAGEPDQRDGALETGGHEGVRKL